jgi:hypothetical protein
MFIANLTELKKKIIDTKFVVLNFLFSALFSSLVILVFFACKVIFCNQMLSSKCVKYLVCECF